MEILERNLTTFSRKCDCGVALYGIILWTEGKEQSFKKLGMIMLVRCVWFKLNIFKLLQNLMLF